MKMNRLELQSRRSSLTTLLGAGLLSGLAPALSAQGSPPPEDPPVAPEAFRVENVLDLELLGLSATSDVQRVGWGDFHRDRAGSLALLVDGSLYYSLIPYLLQSLAEVEAGATGVVDFASVSDGNEGHDLLATDSRGLVYYTADLATDGFGAPVVLEAGGWIGASMLDTNLVPNATSSIVAGVATDGKTINLGRLANGVWTPYSPVTMPLDVIDYALFDDGDDGSLDLAVVLSAGLFFYDLNGTFLGRWTSSSSIGGVAPVYCDDGLNTTASVVAWYYENTATGNYELTAADSSTLQASTEITVSVDIGLPDQNLTPRSIAVGDYDNDGADDVMITTELHAAVLFENRFPDNTSKFFNNSSNRTAVFPSDEDPTLPTAGTSEVCVSDFDFESFASPVVVDEEGQRVILYKRDADDQGGSGLEFSFTSAQMVDDATSYETSSTAPSGTTELKLALNVPPAILSAQQPYDHLQVLVFYQQDPTFSLTSAAVTNNAYPLHTEPTTAHWAPVPLHRPGGGDIVGEYWDNPHHHLWVLFRFVDFVDDQAAVLEVSDNTPFYFVSMTLQSDSDKQFAPFDLSFASYLESFSDAGDAEAMIPTSAPGTFGNTYVGAFVTQTQSPVFPPFEPPSQGPITRVDSTPTASFGL